MVTMPLAVNQGYEIVETLTLTTAMPQIFNIIVLALNDICYSGYSRISRVQQKTRPTILCLYSAVRCQNIYLDDLR